MDPTFPTPESPPTLVPTTAAPTPKAKPKRIRGLGTPQPILTNKRQRHQPKLLIKGNYVREVRSNIAYHVTVQQMSILLDEPIADIFKASNSDPDTMTLQQALAQTENYDKWIEALEKEIRALEEHGVWEEVPVSEAKGDIVPSHFVMKIKRKPDGSLDKFKARLVVAGN